MRKEFKEYGYDWMLYTLSRTAKSALSATDKEFDALLRLLPHLQTPIGLLGTLGDAGRHLMTAVEGWMHNICFAEEKGLKRVLTTFCFPAGVLKAFDCVPLNMEIMTGFGNLLWPRGVYEYYDYCTELGMTDTSCAGQRGAIGAYLAGAGSRPDFVLINSPGFCDSNMNSFQFYASYMDVPFYATNCTPELTSDRARAYHRKDFRTMLSFLEEQTGKKMDWDLLREVIRETQRQDALVDEIMTLMAAVPNPVPGIATIVMYMVKLAFSGFSEATPVLEEILRVSKENYSKGISGNRSGKETARLFPFYIDHFTLGFRFWKFLDRYDISHMGSLLNYFWNEGAPYYKGNPDEMYHLDLSSEDAMIDGLADQLQRMPMVKQIIGPMRSKTQWLEDTLNSAKLFKADCLTYIGTLGCRNSWSVVKSMVRETEKAGLPSYILYSDAFDDRAVSWDACEDKLLEFFKVRKILV